MSLNPREAKPFRERRKSGRPSGIWVRRRRGQVRRPRYTPAALPFPLQERIERRRVPGAAFDIAATLELNLDNFPSRAAMLTLLQSWLYLAEQDGLQARRRDYVEALNAAIQVMAESRTPAEAIERLHTERWGD